MMCIQLPQFIGNSYMKKILAATISSTLLIACVPEQLIWEVTPIGTTSSNTPEYNFGTAVLGPISFGGSCSSSTNYIDWRGNQTITFDYLADGTYSDCTITITDEGDKKYGTDTLEISPFTIGEVTSCTASAGEYLASGDPTNIFASPTVRFPDSFTTSYGMTIAITSGFEVGDTLTYSGSNIDVTTSWNAATGILELDYITDSSGWEPILSDVQFVTNSAKGLNKTVSFAAHDESADQATGPIYSPVQSKYFEYVAAPASSYSTAQAACAARTLHGIQGHLATVLTSEKQDELYHYFGGNDFWLGAKGLSDGATSSWAWDVPPISNIFFIGDSSSGFVVGDSYSNWDTNNPVLVGRTPLYALMGADGYWTSHLDTDASTVTGYACAYDAGTAPADEFSGTVELQPAACDSGGGS